MQTNTVLDRQTHRHTYRQTDRARHTDTQLSTQTVTHRHI